MDNLTTIGLDLAKNVFQAHGTGADGTVVFSKKLRRDQVLRFFAEQPHCTVAMEACPGAHHWGRAIRDLGHEVAADRTRLRQAVREAAEERRGRCGGYRRSGDEIDGNERRGLSNDGVDAPGAGAVQWRGRASSANTLELMNAGIPSETLRMRSPRHGSRRAPSARAPVQDRSRPSPRQRSARSRRPCRRRSRASPRTGRAPR